jgi:DNA segregation ATPase FtsK/SpoIIIE-like protein
MSILQKDLDAARTLVIERQSGSIALIQRHLRLSYALAVDLMQALGDEGLVSTPDEHGVRTYLGVGGIRACDGEGPNP